MLVYQTKPTYRIEKVANIELLRKFDGGKKEVGVASHQINARLAEKQLKYYI